MIVGFGRHQGKLLEQLVLKEPEYVEWILAQPNPRGQMIAVQSELQRLIAKFDSKPFIEICQGSECDNNATRMVVYMSNTTVPTWWCDSCDPYQNGADRGKLQAISKYRNARSHVAVYCNGRKSDHVRLIRAMARAKGLAKRVADAQAEAFFM